MRKYSIPRKSLTLIAVLISLLITLSLVSTALQNGYDLFQKALAKERGEGNLEEAISLYKKVVKEASDESLAAKAQLRIGICYEKLGMKEAQKAFQKVIDNYPGQTETVKVAKEKLTILLRAQAVVEKGDKEFKIRKVWAGSDVSTSGEISPDSRYLSCAGGEGDLVIREMTTGKKHNLTKKGSWEESAEFASTSRWSPDSKKIAYKWFNKDNFYDLRLISIDGSGSRVLFKNKEVEVAPSDWSPDSKHILAYFLQKKQGILQIGLVSVADGSVRVLKTLGGRYSESSALFSPNGEYIAYDFRPQKDIQQLDIFLLSTDENFEIPLVEHQANDRLLGWTPDGKSVLFVSNRTGTTDAWIIRVKEGKPQGPPEMIKKDIGQIWPRGFTNKGSFYYSIMTTMVDVYIASLDMKEGKFLEQPTNAAQRFEGFNLVPDWSPDGNYLAYVSYRNVEGKDFCVLCLRSVKTGEIRTVSSPQLNYFRYISWAPDGRSIIAIGLDKENRSGMYKMDVQTGDATSIVKFERGTIIKQPAWSLDGKAIFYPYTQWTKKLSRVLVRDLETGQEMELYRQIAPPDIGSVTLSPDGKYLAFLTAEGDMAKKKLTDILRVIPVAGGKPCDLVQIPLPETIGPYAWTPTGREILFAKGLDYRKKDKKCELWMIPAQGGEARSLGLTIDRIFNLSIHPDGQRIAFSSGKPAAEVWVMENFLPEEEKGKGGQK
jgi:Tol biopolymer transport system component